MTDPITAYLANGGTITKCPPTGASAMNIVIEEGVPIPKRRVNAQTKWLWVAKMEVGQSAFVSIDRKHLTWVAGHYNRKLAGHARYLVRKEGDGARIWRIE